MNPWGPAPGHDAEARRHTAVGGLQAFVQRHNMTQDNTLFVEASASTSSSVATMQHVDTLMSLKTSAFERVRELERMEKRIGASAVLLPSQLAERLALVRALATELSDIVNMKHILLTTLQKSVASECLDIEMAHQRDFIALFVKISGDLPRCAAAVTGPVRMPLAAPTELRRQHQEYEAMVLQLKTTVAKFRLLQDELQRVRGCYQSLQHAVSTPPPASTSTSAPVTSSAHA